MLDCQKKCHFVFNLGQLHQRSRFSLIFSIVSHHIEFIIKFRYRGAMLKIPKLKPAKTNAIKFLKGLIRMSCFRLLDCLTILSIFRPMLADMEYENSGYNLYTLLQFLVHIMRTKENAKTRVCH